MYLTTLIITNSVTASNNMGENEGNMQTLQKLHTPKGMFSSYSGVSIKRASRDAMQACGAKMWRITAPEFDKDNPAGYLYDTGDGTRVPGMKDAMPASAADYDDTLLFGFMVAPKGKEKDTVKQAGNVEVSTALSTTVYGNDCAFVQGLKADGQLNPFSRERHHTRYHFTVNANMDALQARPEALVRFLDSLRSLRVGGSHGSNATSLSPDVIAWRFHKEPGCGGLYLGMFNANPDEPVDTTAIVEHCRNLGITFEMAGKDLSMTTDEGIKAIIAAVRAHYAQGQK